MMVGQYSDSKNSERGTTKLFELGEAILQMHADITNYANEKCLTLINLVYKTESAV